MYDVHCKRCENFGILRSRWIGKWQNFFIDFFLEFLDQKLNDAIIFHSKHFFPRRGSRVSPRPLCVCCDACTPFGDHPRSTANQTLAVCRN